MFSISRLLYTSPVCAIKKPVYSKIGEYEKSFSHIMYQNGKLNLKKGGIMKFPVITIFLMIVSYCNCFSQENIQSYWPEKEWRTSTPEEQGFDSNRLTEIFDFVKENDTNIHSIILIRNGFKVLEAYFHPNKKGILHDVASVTKSITSMLIGIAVDKGFIKSVHQPVWEFFPEYSSIKKDKWKEELTLDDLLTMRTGLCRDYRHEKASLTQCAARITGYNSCLINLF